jgi:hypothetical protein
MLSDIITNAIDGQPDMEVVGALRQRGALRSAVGAARADVVMLGLRDGDLPSDCVALFDAYPWIRVLGVSADGRRAFLYELRPQRLPLGEISPDGLVEAIRTASARVGE